MTFFLREFGQKFKSFGWLRVSQFVLSSYIVHMPIIDNRALLMREPHVSLSRWRAVSRAAQNAGSERIRL